MSNEENCRILRVVGTDTTTRDAVDDEVIQERIVRRHQTTMSTTDGQSTDMANGMTVMGSGTVRRRRKIVRSHRSNKMRDVVVVMTETTMVDVRMIAAAKVEERVEEIDATSRAKTVRGEWRKTARVEKVDIATAVTMMMTKTTLGMMQGTEKTRIDMEIGDMRTDEKMTGTGIESGTSIKKTIETARSGTVNTIETTVEIGVIGSDAIAVLVVAIEDDRGSFQSVTCRFSTFSRFVCMGRATETKQQSECIETFSETGRARCVRGHHGVQW
jgi:hypothetical protein